MFGKSIVVVVERPTDEIREFLPTIVQLGYYNEITVVTTNAEFKDEF